MRRNKIAIISIFSLVLLPVVFAQINSATYAGLDQIWAIFDYFVSYLPASTLAATYYKTILWFLLWALIRKLVDNLPMFKGEHH